MYIKLSNFTVVVMAGMVVGGCAAVIYMSKFGKVPAVPTLKG